MLGRRVIRLLGQHCGAVGRGVERVLAAQLAPAYAGRAGETRSI